MRKFLLAGLTALTLIAPQAMADLHRHGGGGWGGGGSWSGGRNYYGGGGGYYRGHHGNDAAVAGIAGLFLGAALGLALSEPRRDRGCYDRCYSGPPPGYYDRRDYGPPQGYDNNGYNNNGYNNGSRQCFRRDLQWDPRSRTNIEVTHAYPC